MKKYEVISADLTYVQTKIVVSRVLHDSRWFEVVPWPDGVYAVTVKDEPGAVALFPDNTAFTYFIRSAV